MRFYPRVLVVQVDRHAVAVKHAATQCVLFALVVHHPLRAVDFQVARVALYAFAQDLCTVEEGFAVADVGVAFQAANVA